MQPSSVDVRCDHRFRVFHPGRYPFIDVKRPCPTDRAGRDRRRARFILHPGEFVLGATLEASACRTTSSHASTARARSAASACRSIPRPGCADPGFDGPDHARAVEHDAPADLALPGHARGPARVPLFALLANKVQTKGRMPDSQLIVHDLHASSHPGQYASTPAYQVEITHVSLSEVLAAMSRALDLTEGRMEGHTVRTCIIGMRIAEEADLSAFDKVALYGALLLEGFRSRRCNEAPRSRCFRSAGTQAADRPARLPEKTKDALKRGLSPDATP